MVVFAHFKMNQPRVYMCLPIPNPSPTCLPIPSLDCPSAQALSAFSRMELELAIYFTYGNIHVSMLCSQIIPPSASPTESKSLFFTLCLFCCLAHRVMVTTLLNSIYICVNILYLVFFFLSYFTVYNRLQFHPPY